MDKETLCRLCATGLVLKNARNVFKDEHFQRPESLKYLINLYLRININIEDKMPSVVCNSCCGKMFDFHTFAIECNKVQEHLKNFPSRPYLCDPIKIEENLLVKSETVNDDFSDTEDKPLLEEIYDKLEVRLDDGDKDDYCSSKKSSKRKEQSSGKSRKRRSNTKNRNETKSVRTKKIRLDTSNTFLDFICHVCNQAFDDWRLLKRHCVKMHNTSPKVKCTCDKYLFNQRAINRHLAIHDRSQHRFQCNICDKSYGYRSAMTRHLKTHTPKEEYPFICSQCPKKFLTAESLRVHEAIHNPKEIRLIYPCTQCESKFATKAILQSHVRAVHENARPFVCDVCGYACTTKGTLQDHLLVHTDERPFPCPSCSQKFKAKSHLQGHLKNHHNEVKIQCPQCPMMLKNRRTLLKHLNVHKDTFKFNCSICNKGFHKKINYMSHMNSHNGLRPYSCLWCSKSFAESSYLRFHKKRMHPVEFAEYDGIEVKNSETRLTTQVWTDSTSSNTKLG